MNEKRIDLTKVLLLGGIIVDRYFEVDRYPHAGQDTLIQKSFDRVGGCCLNVAVTLKNLGSIPFIANKFGDDEIGTKIEQYLDSQALSKDCMTRASGRQTGYCLIILDRNGERTFFTYKGCEAEVPKNELLKQLSAGFAFAYITGYYLMNEITASAVLELTSRLRQSGCQILFDPGALVDEMGTSQLREFMIQSDWLVPNANEWAIMQKKLDYGENLIGWLFKHGVRGIVVKRGNLGVEVFTPTSSFELNSIPIVSIDTTGAGDSFAGGLIHGLSNGSSLYDAVSLANACGAFTATKIGPHAEFSLDDIQNLIKSSKDNYL